MFKICILATLATVSVSQINYCDNEVLGELTERQSLLCGIIEDWLNVPGSQRGQFVTQDFSVYHLVPTVVPFGGLFSTAPDSVDRQDVFAERGFIFSGQSGEITNWQTIGRSIDAVSNKFVSFSQNLSGAAVSTGRSFNSVMTGLFRFRDGETDRNGNTNQTLVDFFEIYSDVAPLVDAFCSDPRYSINSASSSSSDESSSDEDEASLEPVCANV